MEPKKYEAPTTKPPTEPISGVQPIPLDVTAKQSSATVKAALERLRCATDKTVTSACELAREARSSSRASNPTMKAVRPDEPLPEGDVTSRFEAIRSNIR